MHWQAAHVAGPLRALKDHEQAPLGQALAAVSWALVLLLQAMCLAEPAGSTAVEVTNALADARAELSTAEEHLRRLDEQTADLAGELDGLITDRARRDAWARQRTHQLKPSSAPYLAPGATFLNGTPTCDRGDRPGGAV